MTQINKKTETTGHIIPDITFCKQRPSVYQNSLGCLLQSGNHLQTLLYHLPSVSKTSKLLSSWDSVLGLWASDVVSFEAMPNVMTLQLLTYNKTRVNSAALWPSSPLKAQRHFNAVVYARLKCSNCRHKRRRASEASLHYTLVLTPCFMAPPGL